MITNILGNMGEPISLQLALEMPVLSVHEADQRLVSAPAEPRAGALCGAGRLLFAWPGKESARERLAGPRGSRSFGSRLVNGLCFEGPLFGAFS